MRNVPGLGYRGLIAFRKFSGSVDNSTFVSVVWVEDSVRFELVAFETVSNAEQASQPPSSAQALAAAEAIANACHRAQCE